VVSLVRALVQSAERDEEYHVITSAADPYWFCQPVDGRVWVHPHPTSAWNAWYEISPAVRQHLRPMLKPIWNRIGHLFGAATRTDPLPHDPFIASIESDIIHYPDQRFCRVDRKTIFSPWDLLHDHYPKLFSKFDLEYRRALYPAACAAADAVVVPTEWGKRDLLERVGVPADKVHVIAQGAYPLDGGGARPQVTREAIERLRADLGLQGEFGLYPAQTYPHKNHRLLLEALAELKRRGKRVQVVCPGVKSEYWPAIEAKIRELNLQEQVRFPGYFSREKMWILYNASRFLVFPTLFEGWGFPLFEAFQSGLPVACSRATCLPELAGDAALLFDPGSPAEMADAIHRIATDNDLRATLVAKGQRRAEHFSWGKSAAAHRVLYRRLCAS
jgi:glycosyltransferase involved in cell wall biosynthesis